MSKPYIREISKTWWLKRRPYTLFMLRELSAVFVAAYAVLLLVLLYKFRQGSVAFDGFLDLLKSPVSLVLHSVAFLFVLLHTITWFNLTPRAVVIQIGEDRVPDALVAGVNYVAWILVSAVVAWIILGA